MDNGQKYSFYDSARLIRIVFQSRQNQFFTVCDGKSVFGHGNSVIAHNVNFVVFVVYDGVRHYVVCARQFIYGCSSVYRVAVMFIGSK